MIPPLDHDKLLSCVLGEVLTVFVRYDAICSSVNEVDLLNFFCDAKNGFF